MVSTTTRRRVMLGALGAGAGTALLAPHANAQTIEGDLNALVQQGLGDAANAIGMVNPGETATAPAPIDPMKTLDTFTQQIAGVAPSNLLRTNTGGTADAAEAPVTTGPAQYTELHADTVIAPPAPGVELPNDDTINQAIENYNAAPLQRISEQFLNAFDGQNDPNTIGQAFGAFQIPNGGTIDQISQDLAKLGENIASGQAMADVQKAIDETLASPEFEAWKNNTESIFNIDTNLTGIDRAADGISAVIDSVTANPAKGFGDLLTAAGGPLALITDPIGAVTRAATQVLGPDLAGELSQFIGEIPTDIGRSLFEALPALLIAPVSSSLTGWLLTPLGALNGAGIGAVLGALNPLNLIPGLLSAIPGAILGGLVTGSIGFLGSLLATLPLFGILPLAGAATGSALALAVLATTVFGIYLLTYIPAIAISLGIGAAVGVGVTLLLLVLSGFNPLYIVQSIAGGFLTFAITSVVLIGLYALLSIAIPLIIFGILAPLFVIGGGLVGALLGLSAAALIASIAISLITALSAIPGAIAGALAGFLVGTAVSSWISAIIGAIIGGIVGAIAGNILGRIIGFAIGLPIALAVFTAIAALTFANTLDRKLSDPNNIINKLRRAAEQGWNESLLGQLIESFRERFFGGTDTGRALGDLMQRVNALFATMTFLDGRRLREMLLRGGLLGALLGILPGAATGAGIGALLGFFNPMNLLNGLMGFIAGAIPGALLGAGLGSLLSDLLGFAVGVPTALLSFLPWLGVLFTLWAIPAVLTTLLALASTIVPAIAAAVATTLIAGILLSSPLWGPLAFLSSVLTIIQAITYNPLTAGVLLPLNAVIVPVVFVSVLLEVLILVGAIALAAVFVGIPTFLIVAALFTFPALSVPLFWLASLPLLLPLAAGLSTLTGLAVGSAVDLLSKFITVPAGALIGGLIKGALSGLTALVLATLVRTVTYALGGAGIGAAAGAGVGSILGTIAALLTHLRFGVGYTPDATGTNLWADGRIVNKGGFGDIMSFVPGLSGEPNTTAVPNVATPTTIQQSGRVLRDADALVGV